MKKLLYISLTLLLTASVSGQQFPNMSGYNVDPFHLSPAYAGAINPGTLSLDHRIDWAGIDGGPRTYQLSYHDRYFDKIGIGGKFIYDKTDIFRQMMIMTSYTYELSINEQHTVNFGLSAGIFSNSINLAEYYNDPDYIVDPALIFGDIKSKIKFTTDVSALYRFDNLEAGVYFSSLMFGDASYENNPDVLYDPLMNFLVHAAYRCNIDETWSVKPYLLLRGGQNIPVQVELMGHVNYTERLWANLLFRTGGVWGIGLGGEVYNGIKLNYSYNLNHNVALNTFGGHQISLGFNIRTLLGKPGSSSIEE